MIPKQYAKIPPCPFCGSRAEQPNPELPHGGMVCCVSCGASAFGPKWNRRAGGVMEKLDQAWDAINVLGGADVQNNSYDQGFVDAIAKALEIIEALGGMDPKLRPQA